MHYVHTLMHTLNVNHLSRSNSDEHGSLLSGHQLTGCHKSEVGDRRLPIDSSGSSGGSLAMVHDREQ